MSISVLAIKDFIMGWFNVIPKFMYFLCVTCMSLIDAMQLVIRKLAGLDTYYIDGVQQEGDITISFFKSIFAENSTYPAIQNAFWALVIFSVILLIVATIISVIRQEYMPSDKGAKPSNAKLGVVTNFFKSLFLFFIVPISCVFGLLFLDVILVTVDKVLNNSVVTSTSVVSEITNLDSKLESKEVNGLQSYIYYDIFKSSTPCSSITFSGTMFKTAAYSANRIRLNFSRDGKTFHEGLFSGEISNFGLFALSDKEANAELIDLAFASNFHLKNPVEVNLGFMDGEVSSGPLWTIENGDQVQNFSKYNIGLISYFYNLWHFNFLIGFAFFIVTIKIFVNLIFGLMKRVIELIGLFIISPPIIATMPLDGGKIFGKWRENFLSRALSAVACIVGINVIMLVMPYLNTIELFEFSLLNLFMSSIFMIVGLSVIETFLAMVAKMTGADDVNKSGAEVASKVGDVISKSASLTAGVAGVALKFTPVGAAANAGLSLASKGIQQGIGKLKESVGKKLNESQKLKDIKIKHFTDEKQKEEAEAQALEEYNQGAFEKELEEQVDNDEQYQEEIEQAWNKYTSHHKANKTREEWLKENSKAKEIRKNAILRKTNGVDKQEYLLNNKQEFIERKKTEILQELGDKQFKAFIKNSTAKAYNYSGLQNINSLGSLYFQNIKSSYVRSGKGGFKAMMMAAKGTNFKDMEKAAKLAELQKEETAKFAAQQKTRDKLRNKK